MSVVIITGSCGLVGSSLPCILPKKVLMLLVWTITQENFFLEKMGISLVRLD